VNTYQLATESENIRVFSQPANDLVFNPADGKIYASVPSSAGSTGNSIRPIDPQTGVVGNPVFIGSEPTKLAMANDGHTLYAALDGAFAVRRFDTATQTAGLQITTGFATIKRYRPTDIAVSPEDPNILAIARTNFGYSPPGEGVAVFNNGVQLSQTTPGHVEGSDSIVFSNTGTVLYGTGQSHGFKRINITGTGASVASSSTTASGTKIKYSGDRIFSSAGHVIDAANGTILGIFPSVNSTAFVPDTGVGRAYYLVKDLTAGNTWILKAYDVNTYTLTGSLTIPGVLGNAGSLIRWGGNGLAFRTTGGQLFILQTTLIPSGDPIPAPSATPTPSIQPAPTPFPANIVSVPVFGNNIVYRAADQKIYASVPSSMGSAGNSVAVVSTTTGELENRVFIGSEPNKLALSSDGQKLYVGLDGARSVREFDLAGQTAGAQYSTGLHQSNGPLLILDLVAAPDDPNQIAMARHSAPTSAYGGNAIFDSGVPRTQVRGTSDAIAYSDTSSTLYGSDDQGMLEAMTVGPTGITSVVETPFDSGGYDNKYIRYHGGRVYNSRGRVIDPVSRALLGTFDFNGNLVSDFLFMVDGDNNRLFTVHNLSDNSGTLLRAYDLDTFLQIGYISLPNLGTVSDIKRFGSNGLAVSHNNGPLLLIKSTIVDPDEPLPSVTPTPFPPTPTPTPSPLPVFVRKIDQPVNDIAVNTSDQNLYISVPGIATNGTGNTITRIAPQTGEILSSTFIGSEPAKLSAADDGQTLYATLNGPRAVRRFDMLTQTPGLQFAVTIGSPTLEIYDLETVPGSPDSVVVSAGNGGAAIYDNGIKRPLMPTRVGGPQLAEMGPIEFSGPTRLYGYNNTDTGFDLHKINVEANGLVTTASINNLLTGFIQRPDAVDAAEGKLYTSSGRIADPETNTITATLPGINGKTVAVDPTLRRVFIDSGNVVRVFDMDGYYLIGDIPLPGVAPGSITRIVRWGANGLALKVEHSSTQSVVLVQSPLVSTAAPVPSGLNLDAFAYTTSETAGQRIVSVTRTGEYNTPVTVHYETVDGTALAGSDYTASSGTLSFGPGEVSKSFSVPIVNDNVFDPGESFTVKLTDPAGGQAYLLNPSTATVAITDNDSRPGISDENTLVNETHTGSDSFAIVNVRLTNPSAETVSVNYATANGTAVAGLDYQAANGTLSFAPGETLKTVSINIIGDGGSEGNENFFLNLSGPVNGTIVNSQATVTIIDYIAPHRTAYDFDGDHKADVSLFRPSEGNWYMIRSSDGFLGFHFGLPGDKLVPEEYDSDGRQDIAVFRPSEGTWYIQGSASGFIAANFGIAEDIPQPGDFNGDGKAEIAVFRPSEGNWYTMDLVTSETTAFHFGTSGDKPVVGDYDGDGKTDYAVYRPSEGNWYIQASTAGFIAFHFGIAEDLPVPADYDGDGKTDYGVFRPSEGNWYLMKSTEGFTAFHWGLPTDLPVPADYDGDAKADIGVYRDGEWYLQQSTNGYTVVNFGLAGDKPAPNAFVY
jgi:hypothetical protein